MSVASDNKAPQAPTHTTRVTVKYDVVSGETDGSLEGKRLTWQGGRAAVRNAPRARGFERDELFRWPPNKEKASSGVTRRERSRQSHKSEPRTGDRSDVL